MKKYFLIASFAVSLSFSQSYRGDILGRVVDSRTLEPIPQVNVIVIELPAVGASTDAEGNFRIQNLNVGTYSVRVSAVGYVAQVVTNVVITTGRSTAVTVKLEQTDIQIEGVTTSASYFSRAQQLSPLSANIFDRSEILRSPGSVQDVQRVVQNLPGVASSTDNINELIVRGGAPFENLTVMDNMIIPSINHYSNQFNSAGPINMVNADMIQDVQFSSGGFPVQYGDKVSSVMNLTVREGSRNTAFASKTVLNMAGAGILAEGGFAGGEGSYIFSARNSLLEIVDKVWGLSTLSLTAVPKYWDTQAKVTYDLSPSSQLSASVLYGDSRINIDGNPTGKDELRRNMIDSSSVQRLYPRTKQYAAGVNLRSLYGNKGYSILTLYSSGTSTDIDVTEDFDVRVRGPDGEVLSRSVVNSREVFKNSSSEAFIAAKYDLSYQIHAQHELSLGALVGTTARWTNDVHIAPDTTRYDLNRDKTFETGPMIVPEGITSQVLRFGTAGKYFIYAGDKFTITPRLALTAGLRYDHFTYSGSGSFAPRGSISWQVVPPLTTLSFAAGEYYQTNPYPYYWDRRNIGYNRELPDMKAQHFVLSYEQILDQGLKLSVETYYKKYTKTAVNEKFIYSAVDTFWSDRYLPVGERTVYGLEFFLEQKQVSDYYGTISLSLSRAREKDPRIPPLTSTYPSDYDYPVILTVLAGKVVKGVRDWLNDAPFFIKYPSYILPISNEMEISFKYRYQTGRPYTMQQFVTWKQSREGGVKWSRGAWIETSDYNAARYPDYSRLDLQWLSRFYFQSWNINVYVALMNVFNTRNVFYQNYRSDGTVETIYQFTFFPVLGVEAEF
jgi:hypothetical protein